MYRSLPSHFSRRELELRAGSFWSSLCGSAVMNSSSIHEDVGSIPGLAQWVGVWHCRVALKEKKKKRSGSFYPWNISESSLLLWVLGDTRISAFHFSTVQMYLKTVLQPLNAFLCLLSTITIWKTLPMISSFYMTSLCTRVSVDHVFLSSSGFNPP